MSSLRLGALFVNKKSIGRLFIGSFDIYVYMAKPTPTPVRVARWSALVAGVTALGSFLNTMWTTAPWWVQQSKATAEAATTMSAVAADSTSEPVVMAMALPPELGLLDTIIQHIQHNPVSMTIVGACGLVLVWSVIAEYLHRRKHHSAE